MKWQRLEPYRKFAGLIESHWDGIASYCHPENKVSLGLVEGINNKIRVLQRRAYGYRDEEYLKLKIVAAFLPPLPRNANIKFDAGPAKATFIMSTRGFEKFTGFTGTGLAHPNPTNKIIKDPIGSKCAKGLRVKRPFLAAV